MKSNLSPVLQSRVDWGLYGGIEQYFIIGVDATIAQLGKKLPEENILLTMIENADKMHKKLIRRKGKGRNE